MWLWALLVWGIPTLVGLGTQIRKGMPPFARPPRTIVAAANCEAHRVTYLAVVLTLAGGVFWWIRPASYRPAFCLVDGQQVDYEAAAKAAMALETEEERARRHAAPVSAAPPLLARITTSGGVGMGAGIVGGLLIGVVEALVIAQGGFGGDAQVMWYGPLSYALLLGAMGLAGGIALSILPMDLDEIRGWTPSLALLATFLPFAL